MNLILALTMPYLYNVYKYLKITKIKWRETNLKYKSNKELQIWKKFIV